MVLKDGVARCPCCGDDTMVNDLAKPLCDDCQSAECELTRDGGGVLGYWDCQREQDGDMSDETAIRVECQAAQSEGREISDGCARAIAAGYAEGMGIGQSFATSGAISDPSDVYRDLFYLRGRPMYPDMTPDEKLAADMLGTYLTNAGPRGMVAGWSSVWVGR